MMAFNKMSCHLKLAGDIARNSLPCRGRRQLKHGELEMKIDLVIFDTKFHEVSYS